VKNQLTRSFRKYITYKEDYNELLAHLLEELLLQSQHIVGSRDQLQVTVAEMERRARELGVLDLSHFFESDVFVERGFKLQEAVGHRARLIVKSFAA
jgi:DNA replication licensing factor MCM2